MLPHLGYCCQQHLQRLTHPQVSDYQLHLSCLWGWNHCTQSVAEHRLQSLCCRQVPVQLQCWRMWKQLTGVAELALKMIWKGGLRGQTLLLRRKEVWPCLHATHALQVSSKHQVREKCVLYMLEDIQQALAAV